MTFQRMADRRPVETLVERDDGVWGCVADGVVWSSMRHVSGRRPPHSAERPDRLRRERTAAVQRAEAVADLVHRLALGKEVLPGQVAASGIPPERVESAVQAVREATHRWAALPVGERWVVAWPAGPRRSRAGARRRRPAAPTVSA